MFEIAIPQMKFLYKFDHNHFLKDRNEKEVTQYLIMPSEFSEHGPPVSKNVFNYCFPFPSRLSTK